MQQEAASQVPGSALDYARSSQSLPTAGLAVLSLAMAALTVAWLVPPYLCWRGYLYWGPFAGLRGGPLGQALANSALWPAGITIALAGAGLLQPRRRRRWLGAIAIAVVCVAYPALIPGLWR
jgi:hypothetical protein